MVFCAVRTGQNIPPEAVRSLGTMIGILSRAFFGA